MHVIYDGVELGPEAEIGEYVVVGVAPVGYEPGQVRTVIGAGARIRSHSVIYAGNRIGDRFQTGHGVLIREFNQIGDDVSVGSHSIVEHRVRIGDRVRIHSNVFVPEFSILEDDAWLGPHAVLTNAPYPRSRDAKATLKGPHLLAGAKIGANTTILPGITIGRNALVGAGAVVVTDVPDGQVVVGNPARAIKDIDEIDAYQERAILMEGR
jgi:acetyltransferase-like isoleucine patch superfamily enzyme